MDRQTILLLFGIAWFSAALLTWFLYAKTKAPKSEKRIAILAAVRDLPNGALLKKSDLKQVLVAEKERSQRRHFSGGRRPGSRAAVSGRRQ